MTRFFIDVETTGLNPKESSIVELGCIVNVDGKDVEKLHYRMKPYRGELMTKYAKDKTGYTDELINSWPDQSIAFKEFVEVLDKYVTSYEEKAFFVGYNASFDMDFVREWFLVNDDLLANNKHFGSYFWFPYIDVMQMAILVLAPFRKNMYHFTLEYVYKYIFKRKIKNAHNALADIEATERLFNYCAELLYGNILGAFKETEQ